MAGRYARVDDNYDREEKSQDDFYAPEVDDSGNVRRKKLKGGDY